LVYLWGSLNMIMVLAVMGLIIFYRNKPAIRSASIEFCIGISTGLLLLTITGFLFASEPTLENSICNGRIWTLSLGYFIVFALLFAKTFRIHSIFIRQTSKKRRAITSTLRLTVYYVGPFLFSVIIFTTLWTLIDPSETVLQMNTDKSTDFVLDYYEPTCTKSTAFLWMALTVTFVLNVVCAYYAFRTRRISGRYREAEYIFISVAFMLIYTIVIVPLNFLSDDVSVLATIRGLSSEFAVTFIMITIMGHKFKNLELRAESSTLSAGTIAANKAKAAAISMAKFSN